MSITVNGVDLATLGFRLQRTRNLHDKAPITWQSRALSNRPGGRVTRKFTGPRQCGFDGYVKGATAAAAIDAASAVTELIMSVQPMPVILPTHATRRLIAHVQDIAVTWPHAGAELVGPTYRQIAVDMVAEDPFWYESSESSVTGITTTPVEIPLGDAPVWPRIAIAGPFTDPVITFYNRNSNAVESIGFEVSGAVGTNLLIDLSLLTAFTHSSVVWDPATLAANATSVLDDWDPSQGDWLHFDPQHWSFRTSAWPKLSCSSGTAAVYYHKAYR